MQPADSELVRLIEFQDALRLTEGRPRHLLMGNGFSIDARPTKFNYDTLFGEAGDFSPSVRRLFDVHGHDFERVLEVINSQLAGTTEPDRVSALKLQEREVHDGFMRALSRVHPNNTHSLTAEECANCAQFLTPFVSKKLPLAVRGKLFTTNYDLLIYWVIAVVENYYTATMVIFDQKWRLIIAFGIAIATRKYFTSTGPYIYTNIKAGST